MSTLAKVFVILNLVLSVLFFGSSATLFFMRYNWREAYEKSRREKDAELEKVVQSFEAPKVAMGKLQTENARLKNQNANLAAQNKNVLEANAGLKTDVAEAQLTVQKLGEANEQGQKTIQRYVDELKNRDDQLDDLRTSEEKAREDKDEAVRNLTRVVIDLDKSQKETSRLQIAKADLDKTIETHEIMFENLIKQGINPEDYRVPPIDGVVEAVNNRDQLVVLSVGKDQKVVPGFLFSVRRGGEYVGKVEVIEVYEDLSGARITYVEDGNEIQVGDRVQTSTAF